MESNNNLDRKLDINLDISEVDLDLILDASPFERKRNLSGKLTHSVFFQHLYEESQKNKDLALTIEKYLSGSTEAITILGFSGAGKTTFIRNFINKNSNKFLFALIDCELHSNQEGASTFSENHINTLKQLIESKELDIVKTELIEILQGVVKTKIKQDIENAIATILQKYLRTIHSTGFIYDDKTITRSMDILIMFLYFIKKHNLILSSDFSESLNQELKNLYEKIEQKDANPPSFKDWENLVKNIKISDGFLLLLLSIEFFLSDNFENDESTLLKKTKRVIIIDNLDILPTELLHDYFIPYLMSSLKKWETLFQEIFGIKKYSYKFLLLLRDANAAAINRHLLDHQKIRVENYVPEREFYKDVVTKRINFYKEILKDFDENSPENKIINTLKQFIDDDYYCDVLVPAFNMDYRNMASNLTQPIRDFIDEPNSKMFYDDNGLIKDECKFGFRSIILNRSIHWLGINKIFKFIPINKDVGYCLPARMILSLILNKSKIDNINIDYSKQFLEAKRIKLLDILAETKGIYEISQVLETLTELFLSHKRGHAYLVRFVNRNIEDDWFKEISEENFNEKLKDDYLKITPSGIIFLKDLITHYEFYSKISGNSSPLFLIGLDSDSTKGFTFAFEKNIYNTLGLIKDHNEWMLNFYKNRFKERNKTKHYLKSPFSFKYFNGIYENEGIFQITRLVSSHVEYINKYRIFILNQNKTKQSLESANKSFARIFREYSDLLIHWEKDKKMDIYKNLIRNFAEEIERKKSKSFDSEIKFE